MPPNKSVDEIIALARQLSPFEKLKLIERLAPDLEAAIAPRPLRGLRGMLRGCAIDEQDIKEVRREMWQEFPRGNV